MTDMLIPALLTIAVVERLTAERDALKAYIRELEDALTPEIMHLSAQPRRRREMMEWQPIETAPKDGTAVLVYPPTWSERTAAIARFDSDKHAKNPRPYWRRDDDMGRVTCSRERPPTHWMPLPAPPLSENAEHVRPECLVMPVTAKKEKRNGQI